MTPLDFVLDVLLLDRTRQVFASDIRNYRLPLLGPAYCSSWVGFLRCSLDPRAFARSRPDLWILLLDQLEASIGLYGVDSSVFANFGRRAAFHQCQVRAHRAMRSALESPAAAQAPPLAVSWDEFLCLLGHAMDGASHLWQTMESTGSYDPAQMDLFGGALVTACRACRHVSRVLCLLDDGVCVCGVSAEPEPPCEMVDIPGAAEFLLLPGPEPEPGPEPLPPPPPDAFRVPAADSLRYTPASLLPFGYDFLPFGALYGQAPPEGPCPGGAGSLFKIGADGARAPDDANNCHLEAVSALDGSAIPPIWDHSLFLPSPPYPVPGRVRCAWGGGGGAADEAVGGGAVAGDPPGDGAGRGGAGEEARDASRFIRGGAGRAVEGAAAGAGRGGGAWRVGPAQGARHPAGGERDPGGGRWASVVQRGGRGGPQDPGGEGWPPLGAPSAVGRRRRRDEGCDDGQRRRVRC
jgi:hypothetical protein